MQIPVFKPPIELAPNAKLFFELPTGEIQVEAATGNKIPVKTTVEVTAVLTEKDMIPTDQQQAGLDTLEIYLLGYLVDTSQLPVGTRLVDRVDAEVTLGDRVEKGTFYLTEKMTPFRAALKLMFGTPVHGTFRIKGGGGT